MPGHISEHQRSTRLQHHERECFKQLPDKHKGYAGYENTAVDPGEYAATVAGREADRDYERFH